MGSFTMTTSSRGSGGPSRDSPGRRAALIARRDAPAGVGDGLDVPPHPRHRSAGVSVAARTAVLRSRRAEERSRTVWGARHGAGGADGHSLTPGERSGSCSPASDSPLHPGSWERGVEAAEWTLKHGGRVRLRKSVTVRGKDLSEASLARFARLLQVDRFEPCPTHKIESAGLNREPSKRNQMYQKNNKSFS